MMLDTVIGNSTYVSDTQYDSAGRMTSRALGNGLTQTYGYYDWNEKVKNIGQGGRLETLVTGSLQNLSYVYDKVGNVKQITNSIAGETSVYGYDELNRLTSWQLNQDPVENYSYDSAGNLDVKNGLDLEYDDVNHVHAVTSAGVNTYSYDDNGNQTTRNVGGQTVQLGYDAENRLVSVTGTNLSAQFTYNGDGLRVKSVINNLQQARKRQSLNPKGVMNAALRLFRLIFYKPYSPFCSSFFERGFGGSLTTCFESAISRAISMCLADLVQ